MGWGTRVEMRLEKNRVAIAATQTAVNDLAEDVRKGHAAMVAALEGRTRLAEKVVDCISATTKGMGGFASVVLDRVTKPSYGFIALWVLTLVAIGGLTVADVFDVGEAVRNLWQAPVQVGP